MVRREAGHIEAHLGDDHAGDDCTDARDGRQSVDSLSKGFELLLKPPIDGRDRALNGVDLIEMWSKQEPVILRHTATQRCLQLFRPGFPIWLWYFHPSDQSSRLDLRGFRAMNPARMGDTVWVRKSPSRFSSRSTGF